MSIEQYTNTYYLTTEEDYNIITSNIPNKNKTNFLVVCREENNIVAYLTFWYKNDCYYINYIHDFPNHINGLLKCVLYILYMTPFNSSVYIDFELQKNKDRMGQLETFDLFEAKQNQIKWYASKNNIRNVVQLAIKEGIWETTHQLNDEEEQAIETELYKDVSEVFDDLDNQFDLLTDDEIAFIEQSIELE